MGKRVNAVVAVAWFLIGIGFTVSGAVLIKELKVGTPERLGACCLDKSCDPLRLKERLDALPSGVCDISDEVALMAGCNITMMSMIKACTMDNGNLCKKTNFGFALASAITGVIAGFGSCVGSVGLYLALFSTYEVLAVVLLIIGVVLSLGPLISSAVFSGLSVHTLSHHPFSMALAYTCLDEYCAIKKYATYSGSSCAVAGKHATKYIYAVDAEQLAVLLYALLLLICLTIGALVVFVFSSCEADCTEVCEAMLKSCDWREDYVWDCAAEMKEKLRSRARRGPPRLR